MVIVDPRSRSQRALRRISNRQALGKPLAAVILAAVVVLSGVGAFAAFSRTVTTCAPANDPVCSPTVNPYDMTLLVPLRVTQEGAPIPITAVLAAGESSNNFTFNFGDGTTNTTSSPTVEHTYTAPGNFIISVMAEVKGILHDNEHALATVSVATSYGTDSLGTIPTSLGSLVSNSTSTNHPTSLLHVGQSITYQGTYTLPPTNPLYSLGTPTIVAPGATISAASNTSQGAQATLTYPKAGIYEVTYVGTGVSTGLPTAYGNYSWTVDVAPIGQNFAFASATSVADPHPGQAIAYESYSGGATTFDPAIDYDLAGYEVVGNIYQTLVWYNGSAAGPEASDFVPWLATCIPGSPQCASLYSGDTLQNGTNYTFVINPDTQFYDPFDSGHPAWGVWPSDVMFSILRTMGFSQEPYEGFTNGWIISQALLPGGNGTWDDAMHALFNNTPEWMFAAMTINGTDCPTIAMTQDHGCITFHANATNSFGSSWPFFLELISDQQGGSIVPCGWFSEPAQGQGIPGWTLDNASDQGPHPCRAPTAAQIATMSADPTLFDSWEQNYYNSVTNVYAGNTQWRPVGSGPYYLSGFTLGESYDLAANPDYASNPDCTWSACQPPAHDYVPIVKVDWESDPALGEQSLASGVADIASFPTTDTGYLLQLIEDGRADALVVPSLAVNTLFFALNFSVARDHTYTTNPVTIPSDFFSYLGMRQFMVHAYPYASVQSTLNTVDGIQYAFDFGGAIPDFMGNYYPHDIDWPSGNPCTSASDLSCPAYWWAAMQNSSGPYYDPEVAEYCIPAPHCEFPVYNSAGSPDEDERLALFASSVASVSGGDITMSVVDIPATTITSEGEAGPGTNALPMEIGTWFPDYPDPTDYTYPFYYPDATFTLPEATAEGLGSWYVTATPNPSNSTLPGTSTPCPTNYNFYVNITSNGYPVVPQSCQGAAYDAMIGLMTLAGSLPPTGVRVMDYAQAETIANQLAIMISEYQQNLVIPYAPWDNPSSISTNVIYAGFFWWWLVNGNGVLSSSAS